jgi:hypothetical protein
MHSVELTSDNFLLFCVKSYTNPSCMGMKEFENDLKRFKYIKRLLKRYKKTEVISERLLLNHIILLHNVFGEAIIPLLFYKIDEEHWSQIKTFLVFLNYLPDDYKVKKDLSEIDIALDRNIVNKLRKI